MLISLLLVLSWQRIVLKSVLDFISCSTAGRLRDQPVIVLIHQQMFFLMPNKSAAQFEHNYNRAFHDYGAVFDHLLES